MCWPEAVGSFFGFACVAKLNWRAGIEGIKPVRTLIPEALSPVECRLLPALTDL